MLSRRVNLACSLAGDQGHQKFAAVGTHTSSLRLLRPSAYTYSQIFSMSSQSVTMPCSSGYPNLQQAPVLRSRLLADEELPFERASQHPRVLWPADPRGEAALGHVIPREAGADCPRPVVEDDRRVVQCFFAIS